MMQPCRRRMSHCAFIEREKKKKPETCGDAPETFNSVEAAGAIRAADL